jgi:hypothetical protein
MSAKEGAGYYELEQRKPYFDVESSKLTDRREQANLQV